MDDLEEQLSRAGIEDEDGSIDGFGSQVTLKGLERGPDGSMKVMIGQWMSNEAIEETGCYT